MYRVTIGNFEYVHGAKRLGAIRPGAI